MVKVPAVAVHKMWTKRSADFIHSLDTGDQARNHQPGRPQIIVQVPDLEVLTHFVQCQ